MVHLIHLIQSPYKSNECFSYSDGTGTNFCGNHTLSGDLLSTPLTLGHIYSSEGQYVLSVTIDDPFSSQTVDTTFSVSTRDCAQPKLSIGKSLETRMLCYCCGFLLNR